MRHYSVTLRFPRRLKIAVMRLAYPPLAVLSCPDRTFVIGNTSQ
jgi:hypothetical protein